MIGIKTGKQIEKMRASGKLLAECMEEVLRHAHAGTSTSELDIIAEQFIVSHHAVPSFKNYPGGGSTPPFPGSISASVNDEVVHGIPNRNLLKDGDVLSIDMGAILDGWHSDMARTIVIGQANAEVERLIEVTRQSFYAGMEAARAGNRLRDISSAVEAVILDAGFGIVRDLVGHGIGREMHEEPNIPNYTFRGPNPRLRVGMVLAIEPMVTIGSGRVEWKDPNGWPVTSIEGTPAAHYENTVAITENGPEILTKI